MDLRKRQGNSKSICLLLGFCLSGLLSDPADARKVSFQLPPSEKISESDSSASLTERGSSPKENSPALNLAPVGLHDEEKKTEQASEDEATLKSTVSQSDFVSKGRAGSTDKNAIAAGKKESIIDKKGIGDKVLGKGKRVDVGPLALQASEDEAEKSAETVMDAEKQQLSDLWQSTIDRNPDIQFVIQKLQPTTDANHAMAATMKLLSNALFGAMNMAPFMMPGGISQANPAALMGMSSGAGMIQSLFQDKAQKAAKKQAISQEQATILYKIVRDTADKLVASFRDYKKEQTARLRASLDLQDLQTMAAEGHAQDPGKALEMEYTLRKAKRDIDEKAEQERLYHQQLVDLAGTDAVAKLDKELDDERNALANITGAGTDKPSGGPFVNPLQQNPAKTASGGSSVPN